MSNPDRHVNSKMVGVRLPLAVYAVYEQRATRQGRTVSNYLTWWLVDEAKRDHDRPRTERNRRRRIHAQS